MQRRKKASRGWGLGLVLILLLVMALTAGSIALWRAANRARHVPPEGAEEPAASLEAPPPEPVPSPEPELPSEPVQEIEVPVAVTPVWEPTPELEQETTATRVTLMALGDNLIHNSIYWSMELPDGSYDFRGCYDDIRLVTAQYDIACINQETPLVADRALIGNYPSFGTPLEAGEALADAGFDVITQATNHCFDKGETGLLDSISFWRENHPGIMLLGIHDSQADAEAVRVVEKNGIRIGMLNFTYGMNAGEPDEDYMVDQLDSFERVIARIDAAEAVSDFVIVFAHWGEEDETTPNDYQKTWAKVLADGGADLIIGGHTHCLQPLETVMAADGRQVPVFYSLGNFLSHQMTPLGMLGGMASVTLERTEAGVALAECVLLPTMNVIIRDPAGWFLYRPMLLSDYTEEIAATHRLEGTSVEEMQALYHSIVG